MESSRKELIRQKIPKGSYLQKEVVNTPGSGEVPKSESTRTKKAIQEDRDDQLMEKVLSKENLAKALRRVEINKGAAGIDGMELESLRPFLKENWQAIKEELFNGTYKPQAVRQVEIPKPNGGVRLLGIPTVLDRLIQQAILQVLTPIFDPTFSNNSYGFRPKRSASSDKASSRLYKRRLQLCSRYRPREVLRQGKSRYADGTSGQESGG
jgi:RNA-directed DNA polymerase